MRANLLEVHSSWATCRESVSVYSTRVGLTHPWHAHPAHAWRGKS
jgi:hypothetical protein